MKRLRESGLEIDLNDERVLKEIGLFADRCDISEELTRIDSHLAQFRSYLKSDEPVGRPLDFLCPGVQSRAQYHWQQSQRRRYRPGNCSFENRTRKNPRAGAECAVIALEISNETGLSPPTQPCSVTDLTLFDEPSRTPATRNLCVVSGPSGSGKTTLCRRLFRRGIPQLSYATSATTRTPREGEKDGQDYFFLSREDFESRATRGEFLEYAEVHGNLYGTLKSEVITHINAGRDVLMDIDVQGAALIRKQTDPAIAAALVDIFILLPGEEELLNRLAVRGTETDDKWSSDSRTHERKCGIGRTITTLSSAQTRKPTSRLSQPSLLESAAARHDSHPARKQWQSIRSWGCDLSKMTNAEIPKYPMNSEFPKFESGIQNSVISLHSAF